MKNGLYSITTKGFDGVEWPPGGVFFLRNGVLLGGSSFMYYIGSYSTEDGIFKGECVLNPHTPPPPSHLYFNEKDIGAGLSGTYEGDKAKLTATVLLGTKSLMLQLTLRKLADNEEPWGRLMSRRRALPSTSSVDPLGEARRDSVKIEDLAVELIGQLLDPSLPIAERERRIRRLTAGPPEFSDERIDLPLRE